MSCKDILVVVDGSEAGDRAAASAAHLAAEHGAHLTGLYLGYNPMTSFAESQIPPDLLRRHQDNLAQAEKAARTAFEAQCRETGVRNEWRAVREALLSALLLSTRYVDLVAMSGTASSSADVVAHRYADSAVMAAGRPVLLFPDDYRWKDGFRCVMLAWDGSREATRALHDAMPFLARAGKVVVMEVTGRHESEMREPASDIARHLARHDVKVESAHAVKSDLAVGEQLLNSSVDHDADLLVAGAFGHSRLREYALGGVTRHLMTHLTIPMLFSH